MSTQPTSTVNLVTEGRLIALDWGTTNVRAALLGKNRVVYEERHAESGIGQLSKKQFGQRFEELISGWPKVPAIAAGMIGSRQGWMEASYLACPTGINGLGNSLTLFLHDNRPIAIVPGLKMDTVERKDVMRGEETQIAGLLSIQPDFTGTVVLPGTHSKWVRLKGGVIEKFTTYMTGEVFYALSEHTILRHSVEVKQSEQVCPGRDIDLAFQQAVADVFSTMGSIGSRLFALRAQALLTNAENALSKEMLSGLLIGSEFHDAAQDGYDLQNFTIIASGGLLKRYGKAAAVLAATVESHDGNSLIWPALCNLAVQAKILA